MEALRDLSHEIPPCPQLPHWLCGMLRRKHTAISYGAIIHITGTPNDMALQELPGTWTARLLRLQKQEGESSIVEGDVSQALSP